MTMRTIADLDVAGRTVLVRSDLNVPLADGPDGTRVITDDGRIRASLATINALRERGARVVVMSHLGRPKGEPNPALSLAPVAVRLGDLLSCPVALVTGQQEAAAAIASMSDGDVVLLENVRFDARETSKVAEERAARAAELASLGDFFVSDGFGVVHREQASVTDIARLLPHAAGMLVLGESLAFSKVLTDPDRPFAVVLGGSKVSDKLAVIGSLLTLVDRLLIGGGMAFTFLAALGNEVGDSLLEVDQIDAVKGFMAQATERGVDLVLPVDFVVADAFSADAATQIVAADGITAGWRGLDIGPKTAELFASKLADARTVVWNGPMGVFELSLIHI